ncbi:MAG: fimbria/pilus outer membrane usher protein, partial [Stenotrophomonas sp.]
LFGNLSYRGIKIASDERMIPDSQRRYAPVVRGTATSKSRVIISQNGRKLREDVLPPGPFAIDDITGAAYGGDLDVEVLAADGSVNRFSVPFSAVPESVRPGYSKYSATVGEAGTNNQSKQLFAEFTYQRGLSNRLTVNTGARVAENYIGLLAGGVVATPYGAFGGNSVFSRLQENGAGTKTGYRLELNYSKTFQATDTTFTLAGYRYSSSGFRDFSEALGQPWEQEAFDDDSKQPGSQRNQRNQFTVVMNQRLGDYGSLYLTGSAADYFNDSQRDVQFQFGYSNAWRRLSYSLSLSQQRTCAVDRWNLGAASRCQLGRSLGLTVSMPLGASASAPVLSAIAARDTRAGESSYQSVVSGTLGERRATNYAVSAGHGGSGSQWSGNLQTQTALG